MNPVLELPSYQLLRQHSDTDGTLAGMVGKAEPTENTFHIWTHKKLDFGYNGDRIVYVNLTSEGEPS